MRMTHTNDLLAVLLLGGAFTVGVLTGACGRSDWVLFKQANAQPNSSGLLTSSPTPVVWPDNSTPTAIVQQVPATGPTWETLVWYIIQTLGGALALWVGFKGAARRREQIAAELKNGGGS